MDDPKLVGLNLRSSVGSCGLAEGQVAGGAAGLSRFHPAQTLSTQERDPAHLTFAFPPLALDSLWSGEPERLAPAQPFSMGPRAGGSAGISLAAPVAAGYRARKEFSAKL